MPTFTFTIPACGGCCDAGCPGEDATFTVTIAGVASCGCNGAGVFSAITSGVNDTWNLIWDAGLSAFWCEEAGIVTLTTYENTDCTGDVVTVDTYYCSLLATCTPEEPPESRWTIVLTGDTAGYTGMGTMFVYTALGAAETSLPNENACATDFFHEGTGEINL